MTEVVIAGYLRTAQSRSKPRTPERDWFYSLRADELLSALLPELLQRTGIDSSEVDDLVVGSALGVTEQFSFGGRLPIFLANLSESIPAKFVDQQCGSSMAAIHIGFMEIAAGFADIVVAGGLEHMSRVPMDGSLVEQGAISYNQRLFTEERYAHWDMNTTLNMGLTAEKLASLGAFTREELDRWAVRSHRRAARAMETGFLAGEILPLEARQADGATMLVDRDQAVRPETDLEALAGLKPVFKEDGVITAGNASPMNAGAAAVVLMSKDEALRRGLSPLADIRSIGFAGVDPTLMGAGPVPACRKALEKIGLEAGEVDFWEINEAFTVVPLYCIKEMGLDPERVNVMGGAAAIGHPLGATGARLVGTLARILAQEGGRWGCAAACVGGGQGVATVIEREG